VGVSVRHLSVRTCRECTIVSKASVMAVEFLVERMLDMDMRL